MNGGGDGPPSWSNCPEHLVDVLCAKMSPLRSLKLALGEVVTLLALPLPAPLRQRSLQQHLRQRPLPIHLSGVSSKSWVPIRCRMIWQDSTPCPRSHRCQQQRQQHSEHSNLCNRSHLWHSNVRLRSHRCQFRGQKMHSFLQRL